jgi:hypothetical protein
MPLHAGGGRGHPNARCRSSWNSSAARIRRALPGSIAGTAATLTEWRDRFPAGGEAGLKSREVDVEELLGSVISGSSWNSAPP